MTPGSTRSTPLSSYIVQLHKLDPSLTGRIIDLQFLHSYYEPTLFILCESSRTWVGRVAVKKDTCCSVALSINGPGLQRQHFQLQIFYRKHLYAVSSFGRTIAHAPNPRMASTAVSV